MLEIYNRFNDPPIYWVVGGEIPNFLKTADIAQVVADDEELIFIRERFGEEENVAEYSRDG